MLRTTNKVVRERLAAHVLDNFEPENYGNEATALENLREQLDAMQWGGRSIYQTGIDYAESGGILAYYYDCRKFLREVMEQTETEAARYSDEKVWRLYCHLVARTLAKLYTEGKA
jgi:hypothetical protein